MPVKLPAVQGVCAKRKTPEELPQSGNSSLTAKLFLRRKKVSLIRKNIFLMREESFLIRKNIFLTRKESFLIRKNIFLTREESFLIRKNIFLMREESFLTRKESFLIRKNIFLTRKESFLMRKKVFLMRNAGDCPFRRKNGIVGGAETVAKRPFSHRFRNEKEKNMSNDVFSASEAVSNRCAV
ncbi:MAG: hypothetical protein LBL31_06970 [Spirochaetaceae bacterium]|nr:hypothetical protein [Spirochaetaceae bacterium]